MQPKKSKTVSFSVFWLLFCISFRGYHATFSRETTINVKISFIYVRQGNFHRNFRVNKIQLQSVNEDIETKRIRSVYVKHLFHRSFDRSSRAHFGNYIKLSCFFSQHMKQNGRVTQQFTVGIRQLLCQFNGLALLQNRTLCQPSAFSRVCLPF